MWWIRLGHGRTPHERIEGDPRTPQPHIGGRRSTPGRHSPPTKERIMDGEEERPVRRSVAAAFSTALVFTVFACDSRTPQDSAVAQTVGPPTPTSAAQGCQIGGAAPRIGLVTINLQALFFNQINTGAQRIARETGAQLQVVNGNDDPSAQSDAVDNLVANKVNAIIVDAVDTEGIKPAIRRAHAAEIPVVAVDATVDDPAVSTQVGTTNLQAGSQLGDALLRLAGERGQIGIVGALNSTIQNERQKGFSDRVIAGGMTIGTVVDGRNVQEAAQTAAENLLTGSPTLPYAYATGEPALIGLAAAVKDQHRTSSVKIVGWDLSPQAIDGLHAGWVTDVVQQNTFEFGYSAMDAAVNLACGRPAQRNVPIPVQIVTPANVDQFLYYLEK